MGRIDDSAIQVREIYFQKLLRNERATPLTAHEMTIAQSMSIIRNYEQYFDYPLNLLAQKLRNKVSLRDALFLMIDAHNIDSEEIAIEILQDIANDDRKISTSALAQIFIESLNGLVPYLMVKLMGDNMEEEETVTRLPSGLNLDAMNKFMNEQ